MRNASLHYICRDVGLKVERTDTPFTNAYAPGEQVTMPIAHKDGAYFADEETLDRIEGEGQVVLRYSARAKPGTAVIPTAPAATLLALSIARIVSWASCHIPNAPLMPPLAERMAAACSSR